MTDTKKVHWGIIACGNHATRVMLPAFSSDCEVAQLQALASESKYVELSRAHPTLRVYQEYQSLLEDDSVTAVYVGLPNHLHAEWSIRALQAGKHVLCDKPLALSSAEVAAIAAAAASTQCTYAEAFMYRFHPQYETIRQLLRDHVLGEVRLLEAHFHYSLQDFSNIRWQQSAGGGALRDVGCYLIDVAEFLFPSPYQTGAPQRQDLQRYRTSPREEQRTQVDIAQVPTRTNLQIAERTSVLSAAALLHPQQKVDEFITAQLQLAAGPILQMTAGCNLPRRNSLAIFGTEAILEIDRAFIIPRNSKARLKLWRVGAEKPETLEVAAANQYALELDNFSRRVRGEAVDDSLFSDGRHTLRLIEAVAAMAGCA